MALAAVLMAAVVAVGLAATYTMWTYTKSFTVQVGSTVAVQYTLLQDLPDPMNLDTEYLMKVQCTNTATIPYQVQAYLKLVGPAGFDNSGIFIRWSTYNETGGYWVDFGGGKTEFGIGHAPAGYTGIMATNFANHDGYWIDWTGSWSTMNPGNTFTQYVYVTILGSAPTGSYSANIVVSGQGA